jgi:hypothetical protein
LEFKKEITISDIFSFLALVISGFALWYSTQSNNAHIIKGGDLPYNINIKDNRLVILPIELYNTGKEAVLLEHFLISKTLDSILFSSDNKILPTNSVNYEIYVSEERIDSLNDLKRTRKFEIPIYNIRSLIKPDTSYNFYIIIVLKNNKIDNQLIDPLINFNITFSNGQIIKVNDKLSNKTLERNK